MTKTQLIKQLERSLKRSKSHVNECEHMTHENSNFHGGWSKGYFEGKVAALEDVIATVKQLQRDDRGKEVNTISSVNYDHRYYQPSKALVEAERILLKD